MIRCPRCGTHMSNLRCEGCALDVDDYAVPSPDPIDLIDHPERFTSEARRRRSRTRRDVA